MNITKIRGKCQYPNCAEAATHIAAACDGFHKQYTPAEFHLGVYCEVHASAIAKHWRPEYTIDCPNCGCHFGVN